jgi:hypothetical protein
LITENLIFGAVCVADRTGCDKEERIVIPAAALELFLINFLRFNEKLCMLQYFMTSVED